MLGPVLAAAAALVAPVHTGATLGSIYIPRLHERTPFFQGTSQRVLARGPGHYAWTPLPSTKHGTVAIAGHRVTAVPPRPYGPFRYLNRLRTNDAIVVRFRGVRYVYRVYQKRVVRPSDVWVVAQARRFPKLVLSACTPPHSAAFRLVIMASLRSAVPTQGESGRT